MLTKKILILLRDYAKSICSNWLQSYVQSDQTWLLDSLNWDKVSVISTLDLLPQTFVSNSSFLSQHVSVDYSEQSTYLEHSLLLTHVSNSPIRGLHVSYMGDLGHSASVCGLPAVALFCSSFSNVYQASALLTPEVALILTDYLVAYETSQSLNARAIMGFDSGVEVLTHIGVEGLLPLIIFGLFTWFVVYMFLTGAILPWSSYSHSQFARSYVYIFSFSKETRVQLEVVLQTTVLFLFYWAMIIMAFDDDKEETIEYVDTMYFYFFTFIVTYFFCKHSTHYFSFLEASATGSRSAMFLVTQFKGDFLALFSMILRFYSLLLRLKVYDILDDCLDFYYVFTGDFDDDEYINELFFGVHGTLLCTILYTGGTNGTDFYL